MDNRLNQNESESAFNKEIFEHILDISRGECRIDKENLGSIESESRRDILGGLALLFDDLEHYKSDLKNSLEAEYKIKVLLQKNQDLEQFNQIASHDMKEPLRTISSFSQLFKERYSDVIDDEGRKYLRFINDASLRMTDLIRGLLSYSRVGVENVLEKVDCNVIVADVIEDLASRVEETNANILVNDLPVINADPIAIRQLFQNLISNALKFYSSDRQPKIEITNKSQLDKNIFSVIDNGIGIEESQMDKVFGLFSRLHTRGDIEGTGLGLSICKKIVELHNGKMWIESEVGLGTKFFFSLPIS